MHSAPARSSLERGKAAAETGTRDGKPPRFPIYQEPSMKHFHDDLATALVSATLCIATVSLFVIALAGVA